MKRTRPG